MESKTKSKKISVFFFFLSHFETLNEQSEEGVRTGGSSMLEGEKKRKEKKRKEKKKEKRKKEKRKKREKREQLEC